MQKIKSLIHKISDNFVELWLGLLLFIALPAVIAFYLDLRAFFAASLVSQAVILILFTRKAK